MVRSFCREQWKIFFWFVSVGPPRAQFTSSQSHCVSVYRRPGCSGYCLLPPASHEHLHCLSAFPLGSWEDLTWSTFGHPCLYRGLWEDHFIVDTCVPQWFCSLMVFTFLLEWLENFQLEWWEVGWSPTTSILLVLENRKAEVTLWAEGCLSCRWAGQTFWGLLPYNLFLILEKKKKKEKCFHNNTCSKTTLRLEIPRGHLWRLIRVSPSHCKHFRELFNAWLFR